MHTTMNTFRHINATDTRQLLAGDGATIVDIRDEVAYRNGHIEGALRLDNSNLEAFLNETDKSRPVVVCCYHGISSQSAAQYLVEQGFASVYSLDGGYAGWSHSQP